MTAELLCVKYVDKYIMDDGWQHDCIASIPTWEVGKDHDSLNFVGKSPNKEVRRIVGSRRFETFLTSKLDLSVDSVREIYLKTYYLTSIKTIQTA